MTLLIGVIGGEFVAVLALLQNHSTIVGKVLVLLGLAAGIQALTQSLFEGPMVALRGWVPEHLVVPLKYAVLLVIAAVVVLTVVFHSKVIIPAAILGLFVLFVLLTGFADDLPGFGERQVRAAEKGEEEPDGGASDSPAGARSPGDD